MRAFNLRTKKELSENVIVAKRLLERMKGLIGKKGLENGESLWIKPCKSVHTFGMRFPIDVIFLDEEKKVVALKKAILKNRMTPLYFKAVSVLELPAGTIDATDTRIGDKIEIA